MPKNYLLGSKHAAKIQMRWERKQAAIFPNLSAYNYLYSCHLSPAACVLLLLAIHAPSNINASGTQTLHANSSRLNN